KQVGSGFGGVAEETRLVRCLNERGGVMADDEGEGGLVLGVGRLEVRGFSEVGFGGFVIFSLEGFCAGEEGLAGFRRAMGVAGFFGVSAGLRGGDGPQGHGRQQERGLQAAVHAGSVASRSVRKFEAQASGWCSISCSKV